MKQHVEEVRPGFVRLTASDRPGVAQPVPEREVPAQPWGAILLGAVVLAALGVAGWEWHWRAFGSVPSYRNSDGKWAEQRRRIDNGEGDGTVLIGSSRVLFDVQLPVWEKVAGTRPIQLALEGTSPIPMLEDLAEDPDFTGRLLVGVAPDIFFSGFAYRGDVLPYYRKEGPSQRTGTWLSKRLIEPWFAFYDADFALATVLRRQDWPEREGVPKRTRVRKLIVQDIDRNSRMWSKVENDPEYQAHARAIWAEDFGGPLPGMDTPEAKSKSIGAQVGKAQAAIAKLNARGIPVIFLRPPSDGEYYAFEEKYLPRAETWDVLLQRTGVPGIHFMDHAQLRGYQLPEWSHLSASDADRFTADLVPLAESAFEAAAKSLPTRTP